MPALAAATSRSACATSGRRSSNSEGIPTGILGGFKINSLGFMVNVEAGSPIKTAIACSNCAEQRHYL